MFLHNQEMGAGGGKLGFVKTTLDLALERPQMKGNVLSYMEEIMKKTKVPMKYWNILKVAKWQPSNNEEA